MHPPASSSTSEDPSSTGEPGRAVAAAALTEPFWRSWLRRLSRQALVWAWVFSVGVHLVVLGAMVFVAFPERSGAFDAPVANVRSVISSVPPRADAGPIARPELIPSPPPVVPPPPVESSDRIVRPLPPLSEYRAGLFPRGIGAGAGGDGAGGGAGDAGVGAGRGGQGLPVMGLGGGGGRGDFGAMGLTLGGGGGPQFFGVGGGVKGVEKVVYVVDRSGSMSDTFDYVRKELVRSISALRRTQRFHVIFFNSGVPLESPPRRLVSAVQSNREEFFQFLETVTAMGSTQPEQAMYLALSLNPDLVYFLSDGVFDAAFVSKLAEWNRDQKVKICTIAYRDRAGSAILERIARENHGEFTYVSENDLP